MGVAGFGVADELLDLRGGRPGRAGSGAHWESGGA